MTAAAREQSLQSEDFHTGEQISPFDSTGVEAGSAPVPGEDCRLRYGLRPERALAGTWSAEVVADSRAPRRRRNHLLRRGDHRRVSLADS